MTTAGSAATPMTPAEFLAWKGRQPGRYQYLRGEVFAIAGGSPRYDLLAANVVACSPCRHPWRSDVADTTEDRS